jgi:hypothetical protein
MRDEVWTEEEKGGEGIASHTPTERHDDIFFLRVGRRESVLDRLDVKARQELRWGTE